MSKASDLDALSRSLSGDWQSRVVLFRKFLWDNPRAHDLADAYQDADDFLHDSFANALRTAKSFDPEQDLGDWMESVALWTALERQRPRYTDRPGVSPRVRLCVGINGNEAGTSSRLTSFVPPRSSPDETLASRISALVGEPQFTLLSKLAIEKSTWEETAAAVGKPLNTIGPMLVRAVDSLSRFFGAPPTLNSDLEPVFTWIVREDADKRRRKDQPKGRIISMQLDPAFYSLMPEMRKIGLAVPSDVRTITLWDVARTSTTPGEALGEHISKCNYCADLLRALLLMQRALESGRDVDFLVCPSAYALVNPPAENNQAFDRHVEECAACSQERTRIINGANGGEAGESDAEITSHGRKFAWAAVALLLAGAGYLSVAGLLSSKNRTESTAAIEPMAPTVAINSRYRDLAQPVPLSDPKWVASVLPQHRQMFRQLVIRLENRDGAGAAILASGLENKDPGTQMLYSLILYERGKMGEGYGEMLKAESMSPRNSFRCWALLQCAMIVGDLKIVEREVQHLSSDPEYAQRAKDLLARARSRG